MQCRNSPLAKSPPPNLPKIPGVTSPEIQENGHISEGQQSQKTEGRLLLGRGTVIYSLNCLPYYHLLCN